MKLSALNSAIRSLDGAPKINSHYRAAGLEVLLEDLQVQKASLLTALKVAFPDGRNQETFLTINEHGRVARDEAVWPAEDGAVLDPADDSPEWTDETFERATFSPGEEFDNDPLGLGIDDDDLDSVLG
jgi:hypothetical protein